MAPQAVIAIPMDDNGAAFGTGGIIVFGYPGGNLDIGFEVRKWWRNYVVYDHFMDSLSLNNWIHAGAQPTGDTIYQSNAKYDNNALSFAALLRYKFLNLSDAMSLYSGGGVGIYMIQVKRDEARLATTGYYQISHVDYYLETRAQLLTFLGLEGKLIRNFNYFGETRVTGLPGWHRWDNPIELGFNAGVKYSF